jgi:hypothetical protein
MHITYSGKITENGYEYSSFLLGMVDSAWLDKFRREVEIQFFDRTNMIHYLMVKYYLRTKRKDLWKWIIEVQLPFGGDVQPMHNGHQLSLLLYSGSAEETAFRLKYDIKASN